MTDVDPATTALLRRRLPGWIALAGLLAALNYAGNLASETEPDREILYRWSTAVAGGIQFGIILLVVLLLARGAFRPALGLRRPTSWPRAAALVGGGLVLIWAIAYVLGLFLDAGEEQGLVPEEWDGTRWAPFAANFLVVAVLAPVVEELTYRGLGISTVGTVLGTVSTVLVVGVAFGLAHGLIVALPVLSAFGVILGGLAHPHRQRVSVHRAARAVQRHRPARGGDAGG